MKGGVHRTRRLLKAWGGVLGLLAALHLALLVAYAVLDRYRLVSLTSALALGGVFVVALAVVLVMAGRILGRADLPLEDREASAFGRPATARVVRVERTRWRTGRNLNFKLQVSPRRWEYRIFVHVQPSDGPPYEAEIAELLRHDEVPAKGDVLSVRIHPRQPDVVVRMR